MKFSKVGQKGQINDQSTPVEVRQRIQLRRPMTIRYAVRAALKVLVMTDDLCDGMVSPGPHCDVVTLPDEATVHDITEYLLRYPLLGSYDIVIVFAGTYDIAIGNTSEVIIKNMQFLERTILHDTPDIRVGFVEVPPRPNYGKQKVKELNRIMGMRFGRKKVIRIFKGFLNRNSRPKKHMFLDDCLHLSTDDHVTNPCMVSGQAWVSAQITAYVSQVTSELGQNE